MKKIQGILLLLLCLVLAMGLTACDVVAGLIGGAPEQPDEPCAGGHSFAEEWTYDAERHWHAATCEHGDEKSGEAEHIYEDGVCICGAADPHEHSFAADFSYNEEKHWHASTCGHDVKSGLAEHELDESYACTVCGFEHSHKYSREWSSDESGHWHAATCGHDVKSGAAEHTYNADFVCTTCGYGHEHSYSDEWRTTSDSHWREADCGHAVKADEGTHSYDADFVCTACGYAHEHTYLGTVWEMDTLSHWHAATCGHSVKADEGTHSYDADFVCTACGYGHEHTYLGTVWEMDTLSHWHAATCGHAVKADEGAHEYVDGVCFCGAIDMHEHSYSEEWSKNESLHWHAADCGHDVQSGTAAHDYGSDFVCDTCGYEHEHTYAEAWIGDESGHWHESDCHGGYISEKLPHTLDENYICTVCAHEHKHTYSAGWKTDGTHHWHESDCHGGFVSAKEEHSFGADHICTVCDYMHEHTYSDAWSYDEAGHWHAATCGHDVKGDYSEHFLGGDDACVGNCGYKYIAPHEHSFSTKWSKDVNNHWHAATCEHSELVSDEGEHVMGADGLCEVCGYAEPIIITADDIAQGGWQHGVTSSKKNRLRVDRLIPVKAGTVIEYDPKGMELYFYFVDAPGATTSTAAGWFNAAGEYTVQEDTYIGIVIAASGRSANITPSAYTCDITIHPGTGEVERTYEKVNVYRFGGEGNDWCFVYLPEGYDPDRAEPYPFVIANHGNGWNMDGSMKKANWTDNTMYMSAAEIATQKESKRGRFIATEDPTLWYSNPTIEALLAAGYIVCGAQNYGDNLYGNDDCTNAVVDFYNHMVATYNVEYACHMIGASNGAMTTLNAAEKLGDKVKSMIIQYPLASIITHYLAGGHQDNIESAYGLDTSKTYTKAELEAVLADYDVLYKNVVEGVKQGYYPALKVYYSMTDTLTTAVANALPVIELLENSGKEVVGVQVDADGSNRQHGDAAHFDPEGYLEWFETHR